MGAAANASVPLCSSRCRSQAGGSAVGGAASTPSAATRGCHQANHACIASTNADRCTAVPPSAAGRAAPPVHDSASGARAAPSATAVTLSASAAPIRTGVSSGHGASPISLAAMAFSPAATSIRRARAPPSMRNRRRAVPISGSASMSVSSGMSFTVHCCHDAGSASRSGRHQVGWCAAPANVTETADPASSPRNSPSCHCRASIHSGSASRADSPSSTPVDRVTGM